MKLRPLYHRLDPIWTRARLPFGSRFERSHFESITVVRMVRSYLGQELLPVYCYAVGDTLVDTGLHCEGDALVELVRQQRIVRSVITHHHEDHAGNADRLRREGLDVLASAQTCRLVERDLPIRFYQHVLWGKAPATKLATFEATTRIGPYDAHVIAAPGHCFDQVVFYVPERGWVFSGDAFLGERVRSFREDEDFAATVSTLERILCLDFDALLCAHRPRFTGGKAALRAKLEWLREIEGVTRTLTGHGIEPAEIARRIGIGSSRAFLRLTLGDVSGANIVRSILFGPRLRAETIQGAGVNPASRIGM